MARLSFTLLISLLALISFSQANPDKDSPTGNIPVIKVTLLGTGTPLPIMERFGPSILVEAGSQILLFDAGRGCLQRLRQVNVFYNKINALFLTHLHSDHIVGIPDLWLSGWLTSERATPLEVFGPAGTDATSAGLGVIMGETSGSGRLAITGGNTMSRGLSTLRSELPI